VLARCLVPPGADHTDALERVRGLTVAERDAALVSLRKVSLGDRVECEVDCPACGAKNSVDFLLSQLPVAIEAAFDPGERVEHILSDGTVAVMRLPTASDQERLLDAPPDTESERRTFLLASVLLRLGAEEGPFDAARVRGLHVGDRRALEKAIEARTPDLDLRMAVTCSACGGAFSAPFDVAAFFLPR
jgi:hypothetical protein